MAVSFKEFERMDIRVGRVMDAEKVSGSKRLVRFMVDIGEKEPRQVIAGIADHIDPKSLPGKNVIVLANLEPKKFMGLESRGMLLAADVNGKPVLLTVEEDVPPGTKVR